MKLFAFQPMYLCALSFYVCAESQEQAVEAVNKEISRQQAMPDSDPDKWNDLHTHGWGTNAYRVTVSEPNVVVCNSNDGWGSA